MVANSSAKFATKPLRGPDLVVATSKRFTSANTLGFSPSSAALFARENSAAIEASQTTSKLVIQNKSVFAAIKSRRQYSLDEKIKILEEARDLNNREVSKAYGINESIIRRWRREEKKLQEAFELQVLTGTKQTFKIGSGRRPLHEKDPLK